MRDHSLTSNQGTLLQSLHNLLSPLIHLHYPLIHLPHLMEASHLMLPPHQDHPHFWLLLLSIQLWFMLKLSSTLLCRSLLTRPLHSIHVRFTSSVILLSQLALPFPVHLSALLAHLLPDVSRRTHILVCDTTTLTTWRADRQGSRTGREGVVL